MKLRACVARVRGRCDRNPLLVAIRQLLPKQRAKWLGYRSRMEGTQAHQRVVNIYPADRDGDHEATFVFPTKDRADESKADRRIA